MTIKNLTKSVEKVSEIYREKFGIENNDDWYLLKLHEELGELTQSYLKLKGQAKTDGKTAKELQNDLAKEAADVLSHLLLLAKHNNIDLEKEVKEKWLVWSKKRVKARVQ